MARPSGKSGKISKMYIWDDTNKEFVAWDGVLTTGDIEVGAVEIKDHDGTDRAEVTADHALRVDQHTATDFNGAPVTIGTTAVEITFTGTTRSIQITADHDNTGTIWIGKSNITNAGANAFDRLEAGESLQIDFNDTTNAVYCISDTATQKIYKMGLI